MDLLFAMLLSGLGFIESRKAAIVTLIQAPMLLDWQPGTVHRCEAKPERTNGAGLITRKGVNRSQTFGFHQDAAFMRFGFAFLSQVGIPPPGKAVFEVPLALTVTGENKLGHVSSFLKRSIGCYCSGEEARVSLSALLSEQKQDFYPGRHPCRGRKRDFERFDFLSFDCRHCRSDGAQRALSRLAATQMRSLWRGGRA